MRFLALVRRGLAHSRRGIAGWSSGVAAIVIVQLAVYPTVRSSAGDWSTVIDQFPESIKEVLRLTDYTSEVGYLSAELMSFVIPFIVMGYGARWGARLATEDGDLGLADIVLSMPMSRWFVLAARFTTALVALAVQAASFFAVLAAGAPMSGFGIALSRYFAAATTLMMLGVVTMSLAMWLGARTGKRSVALGASMGVMVAAFIAYSLAPLVPVVDHTTPINPIQWTLGADSLRRGLGWSNLAWLVLTACAGCMASLRAYSHRDM
jgi:ABC-2 type transport system permease protein